MQESSLRHTWVRRCSGEGRLGSPGSPPWRVPPSCAGGTCWGCNASALCCGSALCSAAAWCSASTAGWGSGWGDHTACVRRPKGIQRSAHLKIACLKYILNPILLPNQTVPEEYNGVCWRCMSFKVAQSCLGQKDGGIILLSHEYRAEHCASGVRRCRSGKALIGSPPVTCLRRSQPLQAERQALSAIV